MSTETFRVLGIDLGTTWCCVVGIDHEKGGAAVVLKNGQGNRTTPSYIAFTNQEILVGEQAMDAAAYGNESASNTIFDIKRVIGRRFSDPPPDSSSPRGTRGTLAEDIKLLPYHIINRNDHPIIQVQLCGETKEYTPQECSAFLLKSFKKMGEDFYGGPLLGVVVTVPAYFTEGQRGATKEACVIAGLNVLHMINEPTAAAIAHGLASKMDESRDALVYDLGGGTFDVCLMRIQNNNLHTVIATAGDCRLGGRDFTDRLAEHLRQKAGVPIETPHLKHLLREEAEKVKRALASSLSQKALVRGTTAEAIVEVTRATFNELNEELYEITRDCLAGLFQEPNVVKLGITRASLDDVILIGGSTRLPAIKDLLEEEFPKQTIVNRLDVDEAVGVGAALYALTKAMKNHGAVPTRDMVLQDVNPLSLGIMVDDGTVEVIVARNQEVPARKTRLFETSQDYQTEVTISVYQGERRLATDNRALGEFTVAGLPAMRRGKVRINVTFEIDGSGLLNVLASQVDGSQSKSLEMSVLGHGMLPEELARCVEEAQKLDQEASERASLAAARNGLQSLMSRVKRDLRRCQGTAEEKAPLEAVLKATRDELQKNGENGENTTVHSLKYLREAVEDAWAVAPWRLEQSDDEESTDMAVDDAMEGDGGAAPGSSANTLRQYGSAHSADTATTSVGTKRSAEEDGGWGRDAKRLHVDEAS
ncbi:heat shock protein 70 [Calocera cornea HHB12733]|uniref:non-chaperonin molecular chaperone ATPase n=1 Tax=Calocera cornea HHB12733 TaxID=1353952 RepID=A0A165C039_9BASI|nr:heat shock protein 70 [Calocera cornea HHB12733]